MIENLATYLSMSQPNLIVECHDRNDVITVEEHKLPRTGTKAELIAALIEHDSAPVRASAVLDRPAGLDDDERKAYTRGYAQACTRFARRYGSPALDVDLPTFRLRGGKPSLHQLTVEYEWARHPGAHRAGLLALRKYQLADGERLRVEAQLNRRMRGVAA